MRKYLQRFRTARFYRSMVKPNQLCFDIGANQGIKSKLWLSLGAQVVAFEPQSSCIPHLERLIEKYPNFRYEQLALGEESGNRMIHLATHTEVATFSQKFMEVFKTQEIHWPNQEVIQMTTLDDLIIKYGVPGFCKIDAEGYEREILKGLNQVLPLIEFEFTGPFMDETIDNIRYLSELGDYTFNFMLNEIPKLRSDHWVNAEKLISIISSLPLPRLHGNIFAKLEA